MTVCCCGVVFVQRQSQQSPTPTVVAAAATANALIAVAAVRRISGIDGGSVDGDGVLSSKQKLCKLEGIGWFARETVLKCCCSIRGHKKQKYENEVSRESICEKGQIDGVPCTGSALHDMCTDAAALRKFLLCVKAECEHEYIGFENNCCMINNPGFILPWTCHWMMPGRAFLIFRAMS
jgi:hypothetical protein